MTIKRVYCPKCKRPIETQESECLHGLAPAPERFTGGDDLTPEQLHEIYPDDYPDPGAIVETEAAYCEARSDGPGIYALYDGETITIRLSANNENLAYLRRIADSINWARFGDEEFDSKEGK